jgi:hypothetical protein
LGGEAGEGWVFVDVVVVCMLSKIASEFVHLVLDGRDLFFPLNRVIVVEPDGEDAVILVFDGSVSVAGQGSSVNYEQLRVRVSELGLGARTRARMEKRVASGPFPATVLNT